VEGQRETPLTAEEMLADLDKRVQNLESFVLSLLSALQPDGRVHPVWLARVKDAMMLDRPPEEKEQ